MPLCHCYLHLKQSLMMVVLTLQWRKGNKATDSSPEFLGSTRKPCTITAALKLLFHLPLLCSSPHRHFSLRGTQYQTIFEQYYQILCLERGSREEPWPFLPTPFSTLSSHSLLNKKIIIYSDFNRAKISLALLSTEKKNWMRCH